MSEIELNRIDYSYLRPKKATLVREFHNKTLTKRNDLRVIKCNNAIILPLKEGGYKNSYWGLGGVMDSNDNYLCISGIPTLIEDGYKTNNICIEKKRVVYCGFFRKHWGEFLAYCLPRLWCVSLPNVHIDEYVFFVKENESFELTGNYKILMERLGILDRVVFISKPTRYVQVFIPELSYSKEEAYYSQEYLDIFDRINSEIIRKNVSINNKIFLSRSKFKKSNAMEAGADLLDDFFKKNNYTILYPETISLDEMITYIDSAKVIACISGTLPHNMLFSKEQGKGKELIILERGALYNFFQSDTDEMLNCKITYIDANIALYPVELSYGPFIFAWNDYMSKFSQVNNMRLPEKKFLGENFKKHIFKKYISEYRREHGLCLYMPDWMIKYSDVLIEAYNDGEFYFKKYLFKSNQYSVKRFIYAATHAFQSVIKIIGKR